MILDSQWLMKAMATLFTNQTFVKNGILKHEQLPVIWKGLPEPVHAHLLLLLTRFEIAFVLKTNNKGQAVMRSIATNDVSSDVVR